MFLHFHYQNLHSIKGEKRILATFISQHGLTQFFTQVYFSHKKNKKTTSYKLLAKLILTNVLIQLLRFFPFFPLHKRETCNAYKYYAVFPSFVLFVCGCHVIYSSSTSHSHQFSFQVQEHLVKISGYLSDGQKVKFIF